LRPSFKEHQARVLVPLCADWYLLVQRCTGVPSSCQDYHFKRHSPPTRDWTLWTAGQANR